jgi:hypothetical protein
MHLLLQDFNYFVEEWMGIGGNISRNRETIFLNGKE